jgi:hypothetical protein
MQTWLQRSNGHFYQIDFLFQILCYGSHDYFIAFHVADQRSLKTEDFDFLKNIFTRCSWRRYLKTLYTAQI